MTQKLNPVRLSTNNKQKSIEQLCMVIGHPGMQHILESNREGFFSRYFDSKNIVESLRKGNVFNRKLPVDETNEVTNRLKLQEQQIYRREVEKLMNCDINCFKTKAILEESKIINQKQKSIKLKTKPFEREYNSSLKQHKVCCYGRRLSRNKWLKSQADYSSDDFNRLGIDLPSIGIRNNHIEKSLLNKTDIKQNIQSILQPLHFFKRTKKERVTEPSRKYIFTEGDCIPSFLLNPINQMNSIHIPIKSLKTQKDNSLNWDLRKESQTTKKYREGSFYAKTETTTDCSTMDHSKMYRPIEVEGQSMVLSTLPQF